MTTGNFQVCFCWELGLSQPTLCVNMIRHCSLAWLAVCLPEPFYINAEKKKQDVLPYTWTAYVGSVLLHCDKSKYMEYNPSIWCTKWWASLETVWERGGPFKNTLQVTVPSVYHHQSRGDNHLQWFFLGCYMENRLRLYSLLLHQFIENIENHSKEHLIKKIKGPICNSQLLASNK